MRGRANIRANRRQHRMRLASTPFSLLRRIKRISRRGRGEKENGGRRTRAVSATRRAVTLSNGKVSLDEVAPARIHYFSLRNFPMLPFPLLSLSLSLSLCLALSLGSADPPAPGIGLGSRLAFSSPLLTRPLMRPSAGLKRNPFCRNCKHLSRLGERHASLFRPSDSD